MRFFLASGVLLVILGLYLDSLVPPEIVKHRACVVAFNTVFYIVEGAFNFLEDYGGYTFIEAMELFPFPEPALNTSFVTSYDDVIAGVPVRIYNPVNQNEDSAMIVYFHGGGFAFGDVNSHHQTVLDLSNRTNAMIVSADYGLAPDYPFPAGHEDSIAVTKYVMENLEKYGITSNRIFTAGDSAGGNLAAAVDGELAKEQLKLTGAILIYPWIQGATTALPSMHDKSFMILKRKLMAKVVVNLFGIPAKPNWRAVDDGKYPCKDKKSEEIFSKYLPGVKIPDTCDEKLYNQMQQIYDPRISVLFRESVGDLSPTLLVIVAEVDILHDEAILYYNRLQKEGVPSELKVYKGGFHGFFSYIGELLVPTIYEDAMNDIVHFVDSN